MRNVILVSLALLLASCGDDGPDVKPTNNGQQNNGQSNNNNETNNNNNESNNNNQSNNNQSNNNQSNNNQSNNQTNAPTNNQTCIPTAGGVEVCDGRDNDCNGEIDEGYDVGDACSVGIGACEAEGVMVCADLVSTECDAVAGTPGTEICDGIDNDCDGEVDEGFGLGVACSAGEGACANDGEIVCMGDGTAACNAVAGTPGGAELCNGMDDDCNGEIDEDFPTLGQPCSVGQGACAATGVYVCSGDQTGVVCSATPGTPSAEVCDGVDNDCDGQVDEGFNVGQACSAGLGVCLRSGQIACLGDGTAACSAVAGPPQEGSETICDGLDNDCDGQVDENCDQDNDGYCRADFTRVGNPAVCPLVGADCNDNDATINPGATEVCDGVDNNCSGTIDIGAVDANTYYVDCDGDNYAGGSANSQQACSTPANSLAQSFCGSGTSARWVTLAPTGSNVDCQDQNANVRPNQTSYFATPMTNPPTAQRNYDYDCNGVNERRWTNSFVSTTAPCPDTGWATFPVGICLGNVAPSSESEGWTEIAPSCGSSTELYTYCTYSRIGTTNSCEGTRHTLPRTQECR